MQQNNWTRTLLKSYTYLDRLVGSIDKTFTKACYSSFYYNSASCNSTLSLSNRLIDLNERKVLLINTKLLVDKLLKNIGKEGAKLLTLKYIDGIKSEDIANLLKCSKRTVTRKLTSYCKKAEEFLNKIGFDSKKLLKMYSSEQWLLDIYYKDKEW